MPESDNPRPENDDEALPTRGGPAFGWTSGKTPAGGGDWEGTATRRSPNHYRRGAAFERRVRADLEMNGYRIIRSAGSKGKIDLLAGKPGQQLAVQCKMTGLLSTAEWNLLLEWAPYFNAIPILAVGGRGTRYWHLTARKTQRGKRPMEAFVLDELAA